MRNSFTGFIAILIFLLGANHLVFAQTKTPRVFSTNARVLEKQRQKSLAAKNVDAELKSAIAALETKAQKALKTEIASIITKEATPPSGDKHDYMSQAPYFWKNPNTPNGLPYVRRDGERNPEIKKYPDHDLLDKMTVTVETLTLAYYFTGKEIYAARATEILRQWFIDAKTKMNPNLEFAQAVPGVNTGRGIGIIETRNLPRVVDAVGLLDGSKSWTKTDQTGVEAWFSKYLEWLTTSKNGRDESAAKNNHGTFYDVQIASFALFVGKNDLAKLTLETAKRKRIAFQIEPDGSQPLELERTKSWDYSVMNLEGFVALAELGDAAGVDLWNFQTADGRGIRRAIEFLSPFAAGEKKWITPQIDALKPEKLFPVLRLAARRYTDEKFAKTAQIVSKAERDDKTILFGF